jgi:hypothetical protein
MLRHTLAALVLAAGCAGASAEEPADAFNRKGFVISSDSCGASAFAHLVGEDYATVHQASLVPADSNVVGGARLTTLEYTPGRLNVVLDGQGRIAAIGCF